MSNAVLSPVAPATPPVLPHPLPGERLLTPADQVARRPLVSWAEELGERVGGARAQADAGFDVAACGEVIRCGNNAGLIHTHCGRLSEAEAICEAQMEWLRRQAARTGHPELVALVVQPWINVGRLRGMTGSPAVALAHFRQVHACTPHAASTVGADTIAGGAWALTGSSDEELDRFGRTVLVVDSLRVLLAARRFAEILDFEFRGVAGTGRRLALFLAEAECVALGRLGRVDEALARVQAYRGDARAWDRVVAHLRWAELLVMAGEPDGARPVLDALMQLSRRVTLPREPDVAILLIIHQIVKLSFALGPSPEALTLAEELLAAARRAEDEVLTIDLLRLLSQHGGAKHRAELDRLLDTTGYIRSRRRGDPAPDLRAVGRLFERIMAALS